MALRVDTKLLLSILVLFCCCTVCACQLPVSCCLSASNTCLPPRAVVDYRLQAAGHGCRIDAVVLVSRRGLRLCVASDAPKVEEVMKHVDHLKETCNNNNYKGKRCVGVKHPSQDGS
ncbi:C-C motif chemokine 19a.1 [Dunckerocampus dactyliophorus]|uniref:C-C motif chemokine 19a.1 n=1 Tax=Dunckerocampus dactyliophorus TaxID=161453 RepID=UPI002405D314|nr:C-C motif chemokine 19a.1 [Dunckerocampus dactyliophorus]